MTKDKQHIIMHYTIEDLAKIGADVAHALSLFIKERKQKWVLFKP